MKKTFSRVVSFLVVAVLIISTAPCVFAEEANTPKEEVVYVNLNPDGTVEEINVVNIVELTSDGKITDYGSYENLRNMTTTDHINYTNDEITIDSKAGKVYYEGKLSSEIIPWNIRIRYYLDGKEVPAEKLPGQSGKLSIQMEITKNDNCQDNFFNSYALQATLTLNTEKFKDISAPDATLANVGKNKQLTYTILPGKGINTEITAEVKDFDMDPISINAIPLNLDIEVDESDITGEVNRLSSAVNALNNGAGSLESGISKLEKSSRGSLQSGVDVLKDGAQSLRSGVGTLADGSMALSSGAAAVDDGAAQLSAGASSLNSGIWQIQNALEELNGQSSNLKNGSGAFREALSQLQAALGEVDALNQDLSPLVTASSQIKAGIDQIADGAAALENGISPEGYKQTMRQNGLDVDQLKSKNIETITALQSQIESLTDQVYQLKEAGVDTSALEAQIAQLKGIAELIGANNSALGGTETYLSTANQNIATLVEGADNLQKSYAEFDASINQLVSTVSELTPKVTELKTAIDTLVAEYAKIDDGISAYTGGVAEIFRGYAQITGGSEQLVAGSENLRAGTESLYGGADQLAAGINSAYSATGQFAEGTQTLGSGVSTLNSGIEQLDSGARTLAGGTSTLKNETSGIDGEIDEKIDGMINSITGDNFKLQSFVSDKNTNIKSVQFVIKTQEIDTSIKDSTSTATKPELSFWQKLLKLFGLYHE